jgi:hypothetical protein
MPETKSGQKSLYDLAKALGRWDNEGGASGSSPEADLGPDLAFHAVEERVLRFLGAAAIMQWNDLPTEIQRKLFDDAASMSDSARQFELKQQIARFLHEHKTTNDMIVGCSEAAASRSSTSLLSLRKERSRLSAQKGRQNSKWARNEPRLFPPSAP